MERGTYPAKSMHQDRLDIVAGLIGGGAAVMTGETTDGDWPLSARDNFYSSNTRTSQGLFVVTLKEFPPIVLDVLVQVHNASGTTLQGACRSYSRTAKTVTIDIRDDEGDVQDPTTSDHVRILLIGRESTV